MEPELYDAVELYNLNKIPLMGKLSMKLLVNYYAHYLRPFRYRYHISDGRIIDLKFEKKRFCHLVGVEKVAKQKFNSEKKLQQYRGDTGYKNILENKITFKHLRGLHNQTFNSVIIRNKLLYFYLMPHIVESPEVMVTYKKIKGSNIECELLIFELKNGVCVHLGIEKDDSGKFYFPRTFFIEPVTSSNDGLRFVEQQGDVQVDIIEKFQLATEILVKTTILKESEPEVDQLSENTTN